ncbi:MAG: hypothetical protein IK144_05925 [Bacteroidaceae bacterium]|nr:hypothetical protein [Bacteroidaceae bacterium]
MTKYELQKLRDLPIEGVAERLGLRVERHKCLCPFHDDHHASLSFRNNKFKCWSCGENGDTISLAMKVLGKDFKEACRWLSLTPDPSPIERGEKIASQNNSQILPPSGGWRGAFYARFFEHPWLSPEACRFLFDERRLDPRVVRWCRLTSWRDRQGINWLQIPYYDREGKLIGIQNRNLGGAAPRFRFPRGSECSIYNLPVLNLLKPGETLFITEGCSDCWAMLSSGHKAIAIPSATLLKKKDVEQLSIINSQLSIDFGMYPDNDAPGERLFLQLKEVLPNLQHHQLPQGCKDFSEYFLSLNIEHYEL